MKNSFWKVFIINIIAWVLILIFTSKFKADSDGRNEIGFPFIFYSYTSADLIEPIAQKSFRIVQFSIDIVIIILSNIIIFYLLKIWGGKFHDKTIKKGNENSFC